MSDVPSPKASRQSRPKWLDPKLFLGILLVLGSMALGARIIGQADNTTTVYVAKDNIAKNGPVSADNFDSTEVRFPHSEDANRYVQADDEIKKNARATRAIGAGEMIPQKALTNKADRNIVDFPVPVARLPKGLKTNDLVNVVLQPREGQATDDSGTPEGNTVLTNAVVIATPDEGGGAVSSGSSEVTLRVDLNEAEQFELDAFYGLASVNDVVLTRPTVQSN